MVDVVLTAPTANQDPLPTDALPDVALPPLPPVEPLPNLPPVPPEEIKVTPAKAIVKTRAQVFRNNILFFFSKTSLNPSE